MKSIVIKPGKIAKVTDLDLTYHSLRTLVGGYIEMTYPFPDEEIAVISNEEAKLLDLAPNRAIRRADGTVIDIYCGVMVIVALAPEGEYRSLTTEEANQVMAVWEHPETKSDWGGAKPNTTIRVIANPEAAEMLGGVFA